MPLCWHIPVSLAKAACRDAAGSRTYLTSNIPGNVGSDGQQWEHRGPVPPEPDRTCRRRQVLSLAKTHDKWPWLCSLITPVTVICHCGVPAAASMLAKKKSIHAQWAELVPCPSPAQALPLPRDVHPHEWQGDSACFCGSKKP